MTNQKFDAGEFVRLKSGGPKMTVESYTERLDSYRCTWFSGAKHNSVSFKGDALEEYQKE